jgi:hypothetical protein
VKPRRPQLAGERPNVRDAKLDFNFFTRRHREKYKKKYKRGSAIALNKARKSSLRAYFPVSVQQAPVITVVLPIGLSSVKPPPGSVSSIASRVLLMPVRLEQPLKAVQRTNPAAGVTRKAGLQSRSPHLLKLWVLGHLFDLVLTLLLKSRELSFVVARGSESSIFPRE